jgi:mono/diheme cytochrome c family protein
MCVGCHGAPGKDPSEIGNGLRPRPPDLAKAALQLDKGELFWIVKNGIKMAGMPAFGATHRDRTIWNIVGFVQEQLPNLTAERIKIWQTARCPISSTHILSLERSMRGGLESRRL